jgi:preprotein translocase subunit YajC
MVESLKVGDTVVTQSGFIGQIKSFVGDQEVLLTVSEDTDVRFLKSMLAKVWDGKETKQVRNLKKAKAPAKSAAKVPMKKGTQASKKGNA